MIIDVQNLPSDTNTLQQIVTDLVGKVISLENHNISLQGQNKSLENLNLLLQDKNISLQEQLTYLEEQLALLRAKQFGKSSEKLEREISELEVKIEEGESLAASLDGTDEKLDSIAKLEDKKRGVPKREKLPEHLEHIEKTLNPDPICPGCGHEKFRTISNDISEVLEYIPASFKIIRYIRPRCVCINCEKIVQAYPVSSPIAKGMAGAGLLSHILIQKYCNHLPFYRQSEIYGREGIELSRSTMASWAGRCARLLKPLVEEIKKYVLASSYIHGDDTTVNVLAPGLGKTKTGRIWTYVRDGSKYGDTAPPAVCYFYSPDRQAMHPLSHLKSFSGVLHVDAYSGYNGLFVDKEGKDTEITESACWAHTRRKFHEVTIGNPGATIATKVLERIGRFYDIEKAINGLEPIKRYEVRQKQSKILVEQLFDDLKIWQGELPRQSPTCKAINYALNNEVALKRFLTDGHVEIDNNSAERAVRAIALGRKNWLFAGSDAGGETAASIYTITETTKLNGVNPWEYLQQVLTRIQDHKANKISGLLPWNILLTDHPHNAA